MTPGVRKFTAAQPFLTRLELGRAPGVPFHPGDLVNRSVVIFSDLLPPKRGGLADHTYHLAEHLSAHRNVTVVSALGVSGEAPFVVRPVVEDWRDLTVLRAELFSVPTDAILLWQYVPHMYGHGGVNPVLPKFMGELRRAGRKQVVIAHEIAADYAWSPTRFWYAWNHRKQWKQILRHADVIPVACGRWVEQWSARRRRAAAKLFTLPSPSSIPLEPAAADHRAAWRRQHQLDPDTPVLVYFGTLNPSKRLSWVLDAWEEAHTPERPVAFVLIGAAPPLQLSGELRQFYRPLGYVPAAEASRALHAADVLALPFLDGISERRTTLMAGLQHGVAVVTTVGHNTGAELRQADWLALTPAEDRFAFTRVVGDLLRDPAARQKLGAAGKSHHDREFTWPIVVDRLTQRFPK